MALKHLWRRGNFRSNQTVCDALCHVLVEDEDVSVRRIAAYTFQWYKKNQEIIEFMLQVVRSDHDLETRKLALQSAGALGVNPDDLKEFFNDSEQEIKRASACAFARFWHNTKQLPKKLTDLGLKQSAVLIAMLDANTTLNDGYGWPKIQQDAASLISDWIRIQSPEVCEELINQLLTDLEYELNGMKDDDLEEDTFYQEYTNPNGGWPRTRIVTAVLAELSDHLTYRAFTSRRSLPEVVALLAKGAQDKGSYNTRRFAIRVLGNLQYFTCEVADSFFEACQDVSDVYAETKIAVRKFKKFGEGSLEKLASALYHPSITVADHGTILLGELGIYRSEELGRKGRKQVADQLAIFLDHPLANREIYDFSESNESKRIGFLYDAVYKTLVKVVAGSDALPVFEPEPDEPKPDYAKLLF